MVTEEWNGVAGRSGFLKLAGDPGRTLSFWSLMFFLCTLAGSGGPKGRCRGAWRSGQVERGARAGGLL